MKQTAHEYLMGEIDRKRKTLDSLEQKLDRTPVDLIKQAFLQGTWATYWDFEFEFTLPMNVELLAKFREFCKYQGYEFNNLRQHVWDEKNAGYFADVRVQYGERSYEYQDFHVAFRSCLEGSTCVIREIGQEIKPVFEVTCAAGAEEGF
jgi:hypothetical protein